MALDDLAKDTLTALIPPRDDATPEKIWRYRLAVSATLFGVGLMSTLHIAWACGFLSAFGFNGFALASDLSQQQVTLNSIQLRQIQGDLRDAKRQVCLAQQSRNAAALYSWAQTLEIARGQYYSISHQWPQVQSCDELIIAGQQQP